MPTSDSLTGIHNQSGRFRATLRATLRATFRSVPYGTLKKGTPGVVFFAQSIAQKIKNELKNDKKKDKKLDEKLTVKMIAEDADVSMQTVYNFLNGDRWGTLTLIYSLERALQQPLWSRDHLSPKWDIMVRDHNASKN